MSTFKQQFRKILVEAIDVPPAIHQQANQEFTPAFVNYIKFNENGIRKGFNKSTGLWHPITDPDGRSRVLGYGHKLTGPNTDAFSAGVDEAAVLRLLYSDLKRARSIAQKEVDEQFGEGKFETLAPVKQEMMVDFAFNLGTLKGFPKFVKALISNDSKTASTEYKRFTNGKELGQRNQQFFNRYLNAPKS